MYVYDVAYCSQGDDEQDNMKLIQVQERVLQFREAPDTAFMGLLSPWLQHIALIQIRLYNLGQEV